MTHSNPNASTGIILVVYRRGMLFFFDSEAMAPWYQQPLTEERRGSVLDQDLDKKKYSLFIWNHTNIDNIIE